MHHDNAPAHTSILVREFSAKNKTVIMPHLPYSPDLAPANFFLFPKLMTLIKGKHFATIAAIKEKSQQELFGAHKKSISEVFRGLGKTLL